MFCKTKFCYYKKIPSVDKNDNIEIFRSEKKHFFLI